MERKQGEMIPRRVRQKAFLFLVLTLGIALLVSCGSGEEQSDEVSSETLPRTPIASSNETLAPSLPWLPCHTHISVERETANPTVPTPEVINIQMLERPYRIEPNDIVLEQNRPYQFIVQAGTEWHTLRIFDYFDVDINLVIPPGGQAQVLARPKRPGIVVINDPRYIVESHFNSTITIVPEGMTAASWLPSCAKIVVQSPPPGADLSTPLLVHGSIEKYNDVKLRIARVEAWSDGIRVGSTSQMIPTHRELRSEFNISIEDLPAGDHTLLLMGYYQNNALAATATMPLTVLHDTPHRSLLSGYVGNIDLPAEEATISLPVTIQGWVVIPGSKEGTGVGSVEIWSGTRETGAFLATATYGTYRPDVAQALDHPPFTNSGFLAHIPDLPVGQVDLHVYVRDSQSGDYVSLRFGQPTLTRRISLAEGKVADAAWPVALAAAPDGRIFFAELFTGKIRILENGQLLPEPFATLEDVSNYWESGLTGLALHPDFAQQPYVFALYVVDNPDTGLPLMQRVVRYRSENNIGQDYSVVIDNLPATTTNRHNGGRIKFGPDGKLYISIGDIDVPDLAQDPAHYAGSILRFNPDGSIPADNPIPGSAVHAIGFRNVFGIAFQPETGSLYVSDNGPGGFDEINKVDAGKNYGWPDYMGVTNDEGIIDPIAVYGKWPQPSYAPTGVGFDPSHKDLLLFCAFANAGLHAIRLGGPEYTLVEDNFTLSKHCMLDVTYSSDGWLYYSTISAIYRARLDDLLRLQEQDSQ